jgi:hypothetical protein
MISLWTVRKQPQTILYKYMIYNIAKPPPRYHDQHRTLCSKAWHAHSDNQHDVNHQPLQVIAAAEG